MSHCNLGYFGAIAFPKKQAPVKFEMAYNDDPGFFLGAPIPTSAGGGTKTMEWQVLHGTLKIRAASNGVLLFAFRCL